MGTIYIYIHSIFKKTGYTTVCIHLNFHWKEIVIRITCLHEDCR